MDYNDKQIQELALGFAKYIPMLAGTAGVKHTRIITGTVKSVDEDDRICSIEGILDNETITYEEVNLSPERNDGIIEIPAIDSTVIVAKMPDGELYVLKCSDISKWIVFIDSNNKFEFSSSGLIINGGTLDGMVKVNSLVTRLNNLENKLNDLLLVLGTTWLPVANDGGAALQALCIPPLTTPLPVTVKANLENTKIKQ